MFFFNNCQFLSISLEKACLQHQGFCIVEAKNVSLTEYIPLHVSACLYLYLPLSAEILLCLPLPGLAAYLYLLPVLTYFYPATST